MNYPLKNYIITQKFGETITDPRGHTGIDMWQPIGTPVYAAESGDIVSAGVINNAYGNKDYGRCILINHHNGLYTFYAHLDTILVQPGISVLAGTQIGTVGNTGNVTGEHLHFEVRSNPLWNRKNFVNPEDVCGIAIDKPNIIQTPYNNSVPNLSQVKKVKVANDLLNMRDNYGYSGKIIAELKKGTKLKITGEKIEKDGLVWYPVQVNGYVAAFDGYTVLLEKDE